MTRDLQYYGFRPHALHEELLALRNMDTLTHETLICALQTEMFYIQTLDELCDTILDENRMISEEELDLYLCECTQTVCDKQVLDIIHTRVRDHILRIQPMKTIRTQFITTIQSHGDRLYMAYHTIITQLEQHPELTPSACVKQALLTEPIRDDRAIRQYLHVVFDTIFDTNPTTINA